MGCGRKVAAVIDLDHTITKRDTYLAFLMKGLRRRPSRLVSSVGLPMAVLAHWAKLRDNTWLKERFLSAILGGATKDQINQWANVFSSQLMSCGLRLKARDVIESHRAAGHHLVMATASFDFYVENIAKQLNFDAFIATESVWDKEGRLKGTLKSENCYGATKVNRLEDYFGGCRNDWYVIAYSDDYRDLPMLEWADYAIAVNPSSRLRVIAIEQGYEIQNWDDNQ